MTIKELKKKKLKGSISSQFLLNTKKFTKFDKIQSFFISILKRKKDENNITSTKLDSKRNGFIEKDFISNKRNDFCIEQIIHNPSKDSSSTCSNTIKDNSIVLFNSNIHKLIITRSLSQSKIPSRSLSINNVVRARTVFSLPTIKSRETRAIHLWKNTTHQLTLQHNTTISNNDKYNELYQILAHPSFITLDQLDRQRFKSYYSIKNHAIIKFILKELKETENSYNQLLKQIKNKYMKPMILASKQKDPLFKSTFIPILFKHLTEFVSLSDKLLSQLNSTNNIGLIFRSIESDLVVFLKYAIHYRTNLKLIRKACNNILFIKIDQENLIRKDTNRLGMSDYLIAPIQRVTRYCLLLKDLQKYIHPSDIYYTDLNLALKLLTSLAIAMDSVQISSSLSPIRTL